MKFVGLVSGGKDSVFNIMEAVACYGHELVCVANLRPEAIGTELDSFMFQTVGVEIVPYIAECLEVTLVVHTIKGESVNQEMYYEKSEETKQSDEVEDLFALLSEVKKSYPEVQAVATGAIFSNY